ncbi:helix-turn-helix transcriptional regulator [Pseudoxanthomonas sp.]|uniref:helix-turn-helix domain-containing protein n=1 Tax=Pseudoxanthomonas sp. TaxID=1871049 RepID=UPI00259001FF|nr:helix-turn-helix transcriptional regulator [Pseudoxanthomonas sp.]MCR6685936.1 helix-turn-helix domain-containing protein [Pseudoxanthomonas sp.]
MLFEAAPHFRWAADMKSYGDRLRAARMATGMTQEQLGFASGVTRASVPAWENDRETPGRRVLLALRTALGRSLDELVCGPDVPQAREAVRESPELYAGNAEERTLLVRYRALPPKRREAVLELLKPAK